MHKKSKPLEILVLVLGVLCVGALLTSTVLSILLSKQDEISRFDFTNQVDVATEQLKNSVQKYSTLLLATRALFHASDGVSRLEFQNFTESLNLETVFPHTQALSWNMALASENTERFERAVQLDDSIQPGGYPEFNVRPETEEEIRYVITYIEPMSGNEGAFGFDIGSNADRRATVDLARDTSAVVATAPITLAQETGTQKGFLMMLPVFSLDSDGRVTREKSEFTGVVVAVFRIGDLILNSSDLSFTSLQAFDVTDSTRGDDSEPVFSQTEKISNENRVPLIRTIDVANRKWELVFTQPETTSANSASNWAIAVLGGLISVLSAIFVGYIVTSKQRIDRVAAELTVDLQNANKELSRSNEDLTQFAFVASHDLQSPIRNVRMSVELLQDELGETSNPEVREYLKILDSSGNRMKALTSDLLSYARVGNSKIERTPIDLNSVFDNVQKVTFELCKINDVSLTITDMPTIQADEQQLERVFVNLIENAIRYAHPERQTTIAIDCVLTDDRLKIRVRDNGVGIDRKFHESIFIPFRRLHRQDEVEGTGLGLSICKTIIERHGGTISVETSNQDGTVFLIDLPHTKT